MDTNGNYIQNQFCSYEIALKLKELGFNEVTFTYFKENCTLEENIICLNGVKFWNLSDIKEIAAPLWQQVIDWFREKHDIHIEIELTDNTTEFYYQYCIVDSKNREFHDEDMLDQATRICNYKEKFNKFYDAREQAILKCIELCKKN